uniref:Uncharacterized protein n=1 Tax=viral metagenome TaxID=1070528 RepID=A0A6C0E1I5_9ZZZZ
MKEYFIEKINYFSNIWIIKFTYSVYGAVGIYFVIKEIIKQR